MDGIDTDELINEICVLKGIESRSYTITDDDRKDPSTIPQNLHDTFRNVPYLIVTAAYFDHVNIIKTVLKYPDICININPMGRTALCEAISGQYVEIVKLLLQYPNTDVNYEEHCFRGTTPLINAIVSNTYADEEDQRHYRSKKIKQRQKLEILKMILNHSNIDVNFHYPGECTALMCAVEHKYVRAVELLLQHPNIDIRIQNKSGNDALSIAKEITHTEIIKLIEDYMYRIEEKKYVAKMEQKRINFITNNRKIPMLHNFLVYNE